MSLRKQCNGAKKCVQKLKYLAQTYSGEYFYDAFSVIAYV